MPQGMADMPDSTADVLCSSARGRTAGSESSGGAARAAVPRVPQYSPAAIGGGKAATFEGGAECMEHTPCGVHGVAPMEVQAVTASRG